MFVLNALEETAEFFVFAEAVPAVRRLIDRGGRARGQGQRSKGWSSIARGAARKAGNGAAKG
jgi:hypothetical protein